MLSTTLSYLCDPVGAAFYARPTTRSPSPVDPYRPGSPVYSTAVPASSSGCGCCRHLAHAHAHPAPVHYEALPPTYGYQHGSRHGYGHGHQWTSSSSTAAAQQPTRYATTTAAAMMMVANEEELAYMTGVAHMRRSIALLHESVRQLSKDIPAFGASAAAANKNNGGSSSSSKHHHKNKGDAPGSGKKYQQRSPAATIAAHAAAVIEAGVVEHAAAAAAAAVASGKSAGGIPVALFKTIRKPKSPPRHQCARCGADTTTQWRNSFGKKVCNPCGMRLWREKRKNSAPGELCKREELSSSPEPEAVADVNDAEKDERRSNIYALLN